MLIIVACLGAFGEGMGIGLSVVWNVIVPHTIGDICFVTFDCGLRHWTRIVSG